MPKIEKNQPKQKRSKEIVDSIVEATARILESRPIDKLSTNKIAETAGVAIGSVYQYFKNRESILDSVFDEMMKKNIHKFESIFHAHPDATLEEMSEILVRDLFHHFKAQRGYLRAIHSMQMALGKNDQIIAFRLRLAEIASVEFKKRSPDLPEDEEAKTRCFLILCQDFGIVHSYIHSSKFPCSEEKLIQFMSQSLVANLRA